MAIRQIRLIGDPVLRTKAQEVTDFGPELHKLIDDMIETMRDTGGVGLAAPQIGVEKRVFVYEADGELGHVVNPLLENSQEQLEPIEEGCLSIPGLSYPVVRSMRTTIKGQDKNGEEIQISGEHLLARVFQHENDHLDGVLFIDRLNREDKRAALAELNDPAYQNTIQQTKAERSGSVGSAFGLN
ncbi:peptide deformylase [Micrococcoides hystricis]|uniref:Peptide deformylase n=1 Tax=Micrococcoides hystricis TaxID=1572761 RepID=A0ABV6P943_9MICC